MAQTHRQPLTIAHSRTLLREIRAMANRLEGLLPRVGGKVVDRSYDPHSGIEDVHRSLDGLTANTEGLLAYGPDPSEEPAPKEATGGKRRR